MYSWPVLLALIALSVVILGWLPTISGIALYYIYQVIWTPILIIIAFLLVMLYSKFLYSLRGSIGGVAAGFGSLVIVAVGWVLSRFSRVARILGYFLPITKIFDGIISKYPGKIFMKKVRDDFVSRATLYIEKGIVEVEESSEELALQAWEHYDRAGFDLSNGEAVLAIGLAFIALTPGPVFGLAISNEIIAGLSITLVVVVTLRLSVLKALLFSNPSPKDGRDELLIIRDWNQAVANNAIGFWRVATFRATWNISEAAYEFYLDWAFYGTLVDEGRTKLDAASDLVKPQIAFILAELSGIGYREASRRSFREDIFTTDKYPHLRFAEGEYVEQLAAEKSEEEPKEGNKPVEVLSLVL